MSNFHKLAAKFALSLLALTLLQTVMRAEEPSPVGLWRTIDDRTHKARGIVRIYEKNGEYFGRIESSFDPAERNEKCEKCTGDRKGQPIIGLEIMRGMKKKGSEYSGGDILDPETGIVYKCRFTLSGDGEMLLIRGFFLVPVLGRTQVWMREP